MRTRRNGAGFVMPRRGHALVVAIVGVLVTALLGACAAPEHDRPWPDPSSTRPVVDLAYTLADDLSRAQGIENVTFTPDSSVCEVVFRAWPNGPLSADEDTRLTVRSVTQAGRSLPLQVEPAGAAAGLPGTLVRARLPRCTTSGETVSVQAVFDTTLGADVDNRQGRASRERMAWLGTAFPLLAWVDGRGWSTEAAVDVVGESVTSETFELRRLDVTAPDQDQVAGVGDLQGTSPGARPGTTLHRFTAPALRDVTIAVGDLAMTSFTVDDTRVTLVAPSGAAIDTAAWTRQVSRSLTDLQEQFGPVPYAHLWLTIAPSLTSGSEYPGGVQFGDIDPTEESWLVTHELAHQWFYGLVGNDQGRDPWLDEAFATYAQEVVQPTDLSSRDPDEWLGLPGEIGAPMTFFARRHDPNRVYVATVYRGGGRALLDARQADGDPERFDAAVLAYLRAQAHRVAAPQDVAAQLQDLPGALRVLREAGALR